LGSGVDKAIEDTADGPRHGYTMHAIAATGISSEGVKTEFEQHAKEEHERMTAVAERIDQKENLIAERVAIDHYRESILSFGGRDPGTPTMLPVASPTSSEELQTK
jgi:bacterioferritin